MNYLGTGDFGRCASCGEQIRLLPHHCANKPHVHRWMPDFAGYYNGEKCCVDCGATKPDEARAALVQPMTEDEKITGRHAYLMGDK